jgi:hypothetical protein
VTDPIRALAAPGPMLLVLLATFGCGGDSSGPDDNDDPLKLDSGARVSQIVLAGGDTLSTIGGDGTRYTLAIPAAAIRDSAAITMTPIRAATGVLGEAGLIAGVRFEPEGLVFARAATLMIELPAGSAHGYAAVADGDGASPHVVVSAVAGQIVTLAVSHFSVAGVVERADAIPAPPPGAISEAAQQVIGAELGFLTGPTAEAVQTIIDAFHTWYASSVQVKLQAAGAGGASDVTLVAASSDYSAWLVALGMAEIELGTAGDQLSQGLTAEVTEGRQLAAAAFEAGVTRNDNACLAQPTNLANAFAAANNALYWQEVAGSYLLPPDFPALQLDAVIEALCLSVAFDAAAFPEQISVGETYPLNVRAGYAIGGADPILSFSPLQAPKVEAQPVGAVAASAAEPLAGLTDGGGTFATSLTVQENAVVINVHACGLGALASGRVALHVCADTLVVRNGGVSQTGALFDGGTFYGPYAETQVTFDIKCTDGSEVPITEVSHSASSSCTSSATDTATGAANSASAQVQQSYTVSTASGAITSIQLNGSGTFSAHSGEVPLTVSHAAVHGGIEVCFVVPTGQTIGWSISGNFNGYGYENVYFFAPNGEDSDRQEMEAYDGTARLVNLSGRAPEGRSCFELSFGDGRSSNPDQPDITETVQASARLTLGP